MICVLVLILRHRPQAWRFTLTNRPTVSPARKSCSFRTRLAMLLSSHRLSSNLLDFDPVSRRHSRATPSSNSTHATSRARRTQLSSLSLNLRLQEPAQAHLSPIGAIATEDVSRPALYLVASLDKRRRKTTSPIQTAPASNPESYLSTYQSLATAFRSFPSASWQTGFNFARILDAPAILQNKTLALPLLDNRVKFCH